MKKEILTDYREFEVHVEKWGMYTKYVAWHDGYEKSIYDDSLQQLYIAIDDFIDEQKDNEIAALKKRLEMMQAENEALKKRVAELENGIKNHELIIDSCFVKNCNDLVVCKKQSYCCNDPLCGCGDPPICESCYATI